MNDMQARDAHYEPNSEWSCKCAECNLPVDEELFDTDYWETNNED